MAKDMTFEEFSNFINERAESINDNLEKAMNICGEKIRSDIQDSMSHTPRNMDVGYHTGSKTKIHHPSLPENPPAPDTGNLRQSIRYEVNNEYNRVVGIVGSTQKNPDYAFWLEWGTSKMAPRPWLRPAMRKNNQFIKNTIAKAVVNSLTGGNK